VDSGDVEVALAIYDELPGARVFVPAEIGGAADDRDARSFRAAAAPVIAARHAGAALDPAALVQAARDGDDPLVAAAPGGLMASLTERYTNRDFARELGLPLVIAARATGGVTNQVRLVGEAARAAGLTVAAIVLTEWADPPIRVQLDARELLT
jgi:dethiobiotin synthetase